MSAIRNHLHFWLLVPALIVLMTWPTFYYVLDAETFWIPSSGNDVWYELWEGWYGGQILSGRADLFYTDLLFYPDGASLIYHQHTVPHMLLYQVLRLLLPISNAYNLAFLLTLLANAAATYVCANLFVKDRWISLFAAAFVGICITLRAKTDAQFWTYYTLPLAIYFLHRAITERNIRFAIASGIAVALTVYIGFYLLVCLALTVGIYGLYLALSRWRDPSFWQMALIAGFVCAAISAPRLVPMLTNQEQVESLFEFRSYWDERSNDLFNFIAHPIFYHKEQNQAYLGAVPILLACLGLAMVDRRSRLYHWLLILFLFIVLRLGTYLTINGIEFRDILLPKHYLNHWFPEVFRGFANNNHWVLGTLLPLAIMACYGLRILLRSTALRPKAVIIVALIALVSIEHYHRPINRQIVSEESVAFVDWLKTEEEGEAIKLIHVPMNTTFLRRYYNFLQMLTGYPQVEGSINRVLPAAYNYINDNLLLGTWINGEAVHCLPRNQAAYEADLDRILEDGFTHLIFHGSHDWRPEFHSFASVPWAYMDRFVTIFRVRDLRLSCANSAILEQETVPQLRGLALSTGVLPDREITVLSAHPTQPIDDKQFIYFSSVFADWGDFAHVFGRDGALAVQAWEDKYIDLNSLMASKQIILRLQDPAQAETGLFKSLDETLLSNYRLCGRAMETGQTLADYFLSAEFPCEIMTSDDKFSVLYSNGLKLENALLEASDSEIDIYLYWTDRPEWEAIYSYSTQIFDAAGAKVQQGDFVIGHSPLAYHRLDKSALAPGDYALKLIVYDQL